MIPSSNNQNANKYVKLPSPPLGRHPQMTLKCQSWADSCGRRFLRTKMSQCINKSAAAPKYQSSQTSQLPLLARLCGELSFGAFRYRIYFGCINPKPANNPTSHHTQMPSVLPESQIDSLTNSKTSCQTGSRGS